METTGLRQPAEGPIAAAQNEASHGAWLGGYNFLKIEVIGEYRRCKAFVDTPMYTISGQMFDAGPKSIRGKV